LKISDSISLQIDRADYERFKGKRIHIGKSGYPYILEKRDGKPKRIALHRAILNFPKNYLVDHVDGNKWNLTRSNLRLATTAENNRNRKGWNQTGAKGVAQLRNAWQSEIYAENKRYHIGRFATRLYAAVAYDMWAEILHGNFARLNYNPMQSTRIREQLLEDAGFKQKYQELRENTQPKMAYSFTETSTGIMAAGALGSTESQGKTLANYPNRPYLMDMPENSVAEASIPPLRHHYCSAGIRGNPGSQSSGVGFGALGWG
jgi:hypothetical protein